MGNNQAVISPKKMENFKYRIISVIGSGSFGIVYKAWDLYDNQIYAIKKMELDPINNSDDEILKEISILDNLQKIDPKPLILPIFYGFCVETIENKKSYLLKFELKDGNMRDLLKEKIEKNERFSFEILRKWTISLIKGLAYLQSKKISHRDLKCENILYSLINKHQENEIRLTINDFGESSILISKNDMLKTLNLRGTFANMAPELKLSYYKESKYLNYNPYKSDSFSLGITLLEIGLLRLPYNGNQKKNMDVTNIKSGNYEKELQLMRKELKEYYLKKACSEDDKKLIRNFEEILSKLLIIDENLRVDFIEIFQEINKIVSKEELFGNLSEEIRQQSGLKNPIHQKNALSICKSQEFLPKGNNSYKSPSEIISFHSKNSMPIDGCCEIVLPTGDRYFGQFSNFKKQGKGVLRMKSGDFYKGDFEFDEMEGYGEYYYENNDKYVGEFKKGQRHGKGLFKFKNVGFYDGNWEDGFQEGHGEFNWDNGDKYKGLFEKGKMHGKGIYEYIDGKKYKGEWKNDQKEGHGVIHLKNGDRYTGEFKNDVYDGKGVYFFQNGEKKGGIWKRGNLLEKKEDCQIF